MGESRGVAPFEPLLARTQTVHQPVGPVAYNCVKVIVIRDGSAILFSEFRPGTGHSWRCRDARRQHAVWE